MTSLEVEKNLTDDTDNFLSKTNRHSKKFIFTDIFHISFILFIYKKKANNQSLPDAQCLN